MKCETYYNTKNVPLADRETYNNTILLLSMVKSEYYYIIGFSRPANVIEIGFDFESDIHGKITESMLIDFSPEEYVVLRSELCNIQSNERYDTIINFNSEVNKIKQHDGKYHYELRIKKDKLIPASIEKMNEYILMAKSDIIEFLEKCYRISFNV